MNKTILIATGLIADGEEILTEVVVYHQPVSGNFGVPPYVGAFGEHDHSVGLDEGDSFSFATQSGVVETVTFHAADFADIGAATDHEVVAAINAQLVTGEALTQNGYFFFRSFEGGAQSGVSLFEENGGLAKLNFAPQSHSGSDAIELTLSIPLEDGHGHEHDHASSGLEGALYYVLASDELGSFDFLEGHLPIAMTPTMRKFYAAARQGLLPGFIGNLDDNADAFASVPVDLLQPILGPELPEALYFAFFVIAPDAPEVAFVSNVFTAHVVQ